MALKIVNQLSTTYLSVNLETMLILIDSFAKTRVLHSDSNYN